VLDSGKGADAKRMSGGIIFTVYEKVYPLAAAVVP
jgi:hypothetical protein